MRDALLKFFKKVRRSGGPEPHAVKEAAVRTYQKRYGVSVFIETGTYFGDMVEAVKDCFQNVYSIELNDALYKKATERFARDKNVTIIHGDSGTALPALLRDITAPALFWLDGHYSGGITSKGELDTPVKNELEAILAHPFRHVILIDDARLFDGTNDYPTRREVDALVAQHGYACKNEGDIMVLSPL